MHMPFSPSPVVKAWCALIALGLILAGTAAITLGGVPELLPILLTADDGARLTDGAGNFLSVGTDEASAAARQRYMQWAKPGMAAIALGMGMQALEPIGVILTAYRGRALRRREV